MHMPVGTRRKGCARAACARGGGVATSFVGQVGLLVDGALWCSPAAAPCRRRTVAMRSAGNWCACLAQACCVLQVPKCARAGHAMCRHRSVPIASANPNPGMQRGKLKLLSASDGANFDKRCAQTMGLVTHQETVALFRKAASDARDPEIKAFATKTLPALEHHPDMARRATGQLACGLPVLAR
ncbi:MAG: DUF4142 domain-containing protein [Comamonadaceae bacterium]|nr:MAG: DUF4142 domain-containing protein [Comamonadaceae bacterium]